jgi:predicted TPR repeat methyltransferase
MSNEWDEYAADWDSNEDVVIYSEYAFQSLIKVVSLDELNILDFGCGTGCLTEKMAQFANRVVGLDTSSAMLAVLKGKSLPNVDTIDDELSEESIAGHRLLRSKFDLIVASSVCGFLSDYEGTLSLLKSLLVRGGLFVQWDWLVTEDESEFGLTENAVLGALKRADFETVSVSSSFSLASSDGEMSVLMGVGRNA